MALAGKGLIGMLTDLRYPKQGDYGLIRGSGWQMWAVRVGTLSRWGHACVAVEDADQDTGTVRIVEAAPDGVRTRLAQTDSWVWSNLDLTGDQRTGIAALAQEQIGTPYDWPAIAGFVLRRAGARLRGRSADHPDERLMCSELVAWDYRENGIDLFPDVAPRCISPGDLAEYLVRH